MLLGRLVQRPLHFSKLASGGASDHESRFSAGSSLSWKRSLHCLAFLPLTSLATSMAPVHLVVVGELGELGEGGVLLGAPLAGPGPQWIQDAPNSTDIHD